MLLTATAWQSLDSETINGSMNNSLSVFTSLFPSLTRRKILQITTIIHKYTAHTPFILLQQNTRQSKRDKILSSKFHKTVLAIHDTVLIHRRGTTPKVTVPGSDVSAWQQAWNTGWLSLGTPLPAVAGYSSPPPLYFFPFFFWSNLPFPFSSHLFKPSGWDFEAKWELAKGRIQGTIGSSL